MPSDRGASSHFFDSHLIGDIKALTNDIVKLDPSATIVVAGLSTLSGVSMGTLTVRVTDVQSLLDGMLLLAMYVPGLGRHLLPKGTVASIGVDTVIAKASCLGFDQYKIPLRKYTVCPTMDSLDFELAPSGKY